MRCKSLSRESPKELAQPLTRGRVLKLADHQPAYRVLVVDDRLENRELLVQLLQTVGFETRSATNGQEAMQEWQQWHPHLIWMDMRMPVMDGYEATKQIKAREQEKWGDGGKFSIGDRQSPITKTVIIALTASAFEEQQANILATGCDDFVRKPFREQALFEKMAEHLGVRYVYEEKDEVTRMRDEQQNPSSSFILNPSSFQFMPAEWIAELHQAAVEVDADKILQLIEQIPKTHHSLAEGLAELLRHFCFDEILELISNSVFW